MKSSRQLSDIHKDTASYFPNAIEQFAPEADEPTYSWPDEDEEYWNRLPQPLKDQSSTIESRLVALAQVTGPAIRRSPLMTEADGREAGDAFKALRSALRLRKFRHEDAEVLHDEDLVLGVRPASDSQFPVKPLKAKTISTGSMESLKQRLELADPSSAVAPDANPTPAKPTAAGIRPGTAFIMMWITEDRPGLTDVSNTVK